MAAFVLSWQSRVHVADTVWLANTYYLALYRSLQTPALRQTYNMHFIAALLKADHSQQTLIKLSFVHLL